MSTGGTDAQRGFSVGDLNVALHGYMVGIGDVFAFMLAGVMITVLIALMIPVKKLQGGKEKPAAPAEYEGEVEKYITA